MSIIKISLLPILAAQLFVSASPVTTSGSAGGSRIRLQKAQALADDGIANAERMGGLIQQVLLYVSTAFISYTYIHGAIITQQVRQ